MPYRWVFPLTFRNKIRLESALFEAELWWNMHELEAKPHVFRSNMCFAYQPWFQSPVTAWIVPCLTQLMEHGLACMIPISLWEVFRFGTGWAPVRKWFKRLWSAQPRLGAGWGEVEASEATAVGDRLGGGWSAIALASAVGERLEPRLRIGSELHGRGWRRVGARLAIEGLSGDWWAIGLWMGLWLGNDWDRGWIIIHHYNGWGLVWCVWADAYVGWSLCTAFTATCTLQ